jgi:hypothetical protein
MKTQQCKVQVFQCKRSPFPKSSKTSAYDWARGQLRLREIRFYIDYNKITIELQDT